MVPHPHNLSIVWLPFPSEIFKKKVYFKTKQYGSPEIYAFQTEMCIFRISLRFNQTLALIRFSIISLDFFYFIKFKI